MKTASSLKSSRTDSPKTPGGISRSLLTPCRRLGLSRNFRKSGPSPFQSPLSSNTEVKQENKETRKRKESLEENPQTPEHVDDCGTPSGVVQTPTRNVQLPIRKKSKSLLASITKSAEEHESQQGKIIAPGEGQKVNDLHTKADLDNIHFEASTQAVSTPVRLKSKSRSKKKISPSNSISKETTANLEKENLCNNPTLVEVINKDNTEMAAQETKEKSPKNLTKECIVVIQKKIFKKELKNTQKTPSCKEIPDADTTIPKEKASQPLFDSDSDDVPLIRLNCKEVTNKTISLINTEDDDDFATHKTRLSKRHNKSAKTNMKLPSTNISKVNIKLNNLPNSQSSADDDDDFFEKKRTILIKKSYDKVMKPQRAKSTGSITQNDIDNLRAKIEMKKKLLLARTMTEDTKELKDLIKKWQRGCQDALMELMDLMKNKFPDKQNMDYSEMLQSLKIPASLVGYDSDNDCFLTPDDESIILANVKD